MELSLNFNDISNEELELIEAGSWGGLCQNICIGAGGAAGCYWGEKVGKAIGTAYGPAGMIIGGALGSGAGYLVGSLFDD